MTQKVTLIVGEDYVDQYLSKHDLEHGFSTIDTILLQLVGTEGGQPCVIMVAYVEGRPRLFKMGLNMLIAATGGLRAAAEARGWVQPP